MTSTSPGRPYGRLFRKNCLTISLMIVFLAILHAFPACSDSGQLISSRDATLSPLAGSSGDSGGSIVTPDGRYVVFGSTANNLVGVDTNNPLPVTFPPHMNIFLRDRVAQTTILVSVSADGTGGANSDCMPTDVSTNGQYVLFESDASNLVPGDTNKVSDVFLRDVVRGITTLISVSTNGGFGNWVSRDSVMSADGRFVAFVSWSRNLAPTNSLNAPDVYVRDVQAGSTINVSSGVYSLVHFTPLNSSSPSVTPDGHYVGFLYNYATIGSVVCLYDLTSGETSLVSTNASPIVGHQPFSVYGYALSDDGQVIAFTVPTTNFATRFIFRSDRQTGTCDVVTSNCISSGTPRLDMTPDGRFIAYASGTNTGPGTVTSSVFLWDANTDTSTLISMNPANGIPTNSDSDFPAIDSAGRYIAFSSTATNLTTNVVSGDSHLFVCDTSDGSIRLVDANAADVGSAKTILSTPNITPDGRFITLDCFDTDLITNDDNAACDVFLCDLSTNTVELISGRNPDWPSATPTGSSGQGGYSMSGDGRYLAYASVAPDLVKGSSNRVENIYLHDLLGDTNALVSVDTNGIASGTRVSYGAQISADGRYVVYNSRADNLIPEGNNGIQQILVSDLQLHTNILVTRASDGVNLGNGDSFLLRQGSDGRFVVYTTKAGNLASGSVVGGNNLIVRDQRTGTSQLLSANCLSSVATPDGHFVAYSPTFSTALYVWDSQSAKNIYTNTSSTGIPPLAISPDGRWVAYSGGGFALRLANTFAGTNIVLTTNGTVSALQGSFSADGRFFVYTTSAKELPIDTNILPDIYLYDTVTGAKSLISQGYSSNPTNDRSGLASISPDGRFIVYRSYATDIIPGDTNGFGKTFLYDRQSGSTTCLDMNPGAASASCRLFLPQFSPDSQSLVFRTWSPYWATNDFSASADLFTLRLVSTNSAPLFIDQIIYVPGNVNPVLTWPAASGHSYKVQFKHQLSDSVWQDMNGTVSVVGGQGYATDLAPATDQRFYRVVAF